MSSDHEAFLLLSLPNATLVNSGSVETGTLALESVHVNSISGQPDVFLVLRVQGLEVPIDPSAIIDVSTPSPGARTYVFHSPDNVQPDYMLNVAPVPNEFGDGKASDEDALEIFHGILSEYATLNDKTSATAAPYDNAHPAPPTTNTGFPTITTTDDENSNLRGQLVLINQDNGEVIGQVDQKFVIQEDAAINERGRENDAVIIDVSDDDVDAMQVFARSIPPDQQDWITKSASVVSQAISSTTNLIVTSITSASSYYIANSAPSPYQTRSTSSFRSILSQSQQRGRGTAPPAALAFLTSPTAQVGLAGLHAASGHAVALSSKTTALIDGMLRRAMGGGKGKQRASENVSRGHGRSQSMIPPFTPNDSNVGASPRTLAHSRSHSTLSPPAIGDVKPYNPPYTPYTSTSSGPPSTLHPPPYASSSNYQSTPYGTSPYTGEPPNWGEKPQLSDRPSSFSGSLQPANSPLPVFPDQTHAASPSTSRSPSPAPPLPPRTLNKKARLLLSLELILSTIDHSTKELLDVGSDRLGAVVGHKYGADAARTSNLMTGTVRNVALVYIDMRGVGRKALLRRAGKEFVKGRLSSKGEESKKVEGSVGSGSGAVEKSRMVKEKKE